MRSIRHLLSPIGTKIGRPVDDPEIEIVPREEPVPRKEPLREPKREPLPEPMPERFPERVPEGP